MLVPGGARDGVAVLAGGELIGGHPGAADAAGFVGVGAAKAVRKRDVTGLHHVGDLHGSLDAAALGGEPHLAAVAEAEDTLRRARLDLPGLYRRGGPYWYAGGFNPLALAALAAGVAPCVPGFLARVGLAEAPALWRQLYDHAWFASFAVSFAVYLFLTGLAARQR